jgi:hypothetical protein
MCLPYKEHRREPRTLLLELDSRVGGHQMH